jgi:catechol 2,3-dioxygenase-like lactoylglutathione lyase family enzyme
LQLQGLDHIAITVRDVKHSRDWYCDVLGLEQRHADVWGDVPTFVGAGDTGIALFPADSDNPNPSPAHDTLAMRHFAFRVNRENFARAQCELTARGIAFEFEDHTISHSIYLYDPDGHRLEITTYEMAPTDTSE